MEREMGAQLMQEVMAYSETTACRRRFLLHYFGEEYDEKNCDKMCDNCRHPKERIEAKDKLVAALKAVIELFGVGKGEDEVMWSSVFRQALLNNMVRKDIESYGTIKMTDQGHAFLKKPKSFEIPIDHDFEKELAADMKDAADDARAVVLDKALLLALKDLRKKESKRLDLPPFVIFQDPSLHEMATRYPITLDEMKNINGVSIGKAKRYATPFLILIEKYVEENDVHRPNDFVGRSQDSVGRYCLWQSAQHGRTDGRDGLHRSLRNETQYRLLHRRRSRRIQPGGNRGLFHGSRNR